MAQKDVIQPYKLASAQDMSTSFQTTRTNIQYMDRVSISINVLSGTPSGTFYLEGRTSLSNAQNAAVIGPTTEWMRLGAGQTAPASGAAIGWDVGHTGCTELRINYASVSGSGTCDIWIAAKRS
jgi:hypothetical protein